MQRSGRDVGLCEQRQPLGGGLREHRVGDDGVELVDVPEARLVRGEARVGLEKRRLADQSKNACQCSAVYTTTQT